MSKVVKVMEKFKSSKVRDPTLSTAPEELIVIKEKVSKSQLGLDRIKIMV